LGTHSRIHEHEESPASGWEPENTTAIGSVKQGSRTANHGKPVPPLSDCRDPTSYHKKIERQKSNPDSWHPLDGAINVIVQFDTFELLSSLISKHFGIGISSADDPGVRQQSEQSEKDKQDARTKSS
jgi:hypothetical protein